MTRPSIRGFTLSDAEAEISAMDADLGIDTEAFDHLLATTPLELHHTLVPPMLPNEGVTRACSRSTINQASPQHI